MLAESALIELAIKWGGGLLALIAVWWAGKRSGESKVRGEVERERHEATERARNIEADYRDRGVDAARERVRDSAIDK